MSRDEKLYETAIEAIQELYNDTSVSKAECRENMQGLIEEIECMIEALGKIE